MKLTKEQKQFCDDFHDKSEGIDLAYHLENSDIESIDELRDILDEQGAFDIDVIYYSNAIKYLSENDPSLRDSLDLAHDMGCELVSLNSETLASLLASQNARVVFEDHADDIDELFFGV